MAKVQVVPEASGISLDVTMWDEEQRRATIWVDFEDRADTASLLLSEETISRLIDVLEVGRARIDAIEKAMLPDSPSVP